MAEFTPISQIATGGSSFTPITSVSKTIKRVTVGKFQNVTVANTTNAFTTITAPSITAISRALNLIAFPIAHVRPT